MLQVSTEETLLLSRVESAAAWFLAFVFTEVAVLADVLSIFSWSVTITKAFAVDEVVMRCRIATPEKEKTNHEHLSAGERHWYFSTGERHWYSAPQLFL